ncbi:MAG TPA: hypothetical protein ENH91_11010 [Leeuwenhoekiella sp.]|nr:hypothetical protein [Leeuwenhoekiella sp.]
MKYIITTVALMLTMLSCKTENKSESESVADNDMAQTTTEDLSPEQQTGKDIAMASGADEWDNVSEVQFTFNVDRGENHMERSWIWNPKSHDVKMMSEKDTISYNREKDMDSTATNADKAFINDAYWLMPQMHLVWDKDATITVQDTATAPISNEKMKKITLTYPDQGGYTPGDAYDFFYGDDNMIKEWIYRKGNASEYSMVTTWDDYKDYNGIDISTMHSSKDGKTKLYFTNIDVKTE